MTWLQFQWNADNLKMVTQVCWLDKWTEETEDRFDKIRIISTISNVAVDPEITLRMAN